MNPVRRAARAEMPAEARRWRRDVTFLVLAVLAAGTFAALGRQDANWDLKNYHFYNAWAFLHGRMGQDIAPAQLQTYLDPLLDVPFYAMVAADWSPRVIAFAMALPAGIGAFLLVKILAVLFGALPQAERRNYVVFGALLGLTAANPVSLLASTMNEWQGAALTLLALWLVVRRLSQPAIGAVTLALAGLASGLASGLKLTAATFAVGMCAGLVARRPLLRRGVPDALVFGLAVLVGVLVTSGPWMRELYVRFGNPFFPFFNQWFHSPWWSSQPVLAQAFGPRTALEWLWFPLLLFGRTAGLVATSGFRDWRMPLLFLAALATLVTWLAAGRRPAPLPAAPGPATAWGFVAIFWLVSWFVWLGLHGIYRYLMPLELLSGALLLFCLRMTMPPRWRNAAIVIVTIVTVASVRYPHYERIDFGDHYVRVDVPPVAPHAAVLLLGDEPMAHVLPFFPPDGRFIGVKNNFIDPAMTHRMAMDVARVVREHDGPLYALTSPPGAHAAVLAAHRLRRVDGACAPVVSNLTQRALELCRLERVRSE